MLSKQAAAVGAATAAALFNAATTFAAPTSYCPVSNQICFQWGVPQAAAASSQAGGANVYFQLRAPTSYQWIGLGIGSQMAGADMFVMYDAGNGNVTLSTRPGQNHVMPTYQAKSGVTLLAGSGITDGYMVANVRCSNCGELTLGGTNAWISAWKSGSSLATTSPSARISYHDSHDSFSVDFTKATLSTDANPFVAGSSGGGSSSSSDTRPQPDGTSGSGSGVVQQDGNPNMTILRAHGVIMSLVFLIGFPVGSMLMPLVGKWIVHAAWQDVFFLLMWAGFGVGYVLAERTNLFFKQAHSRLGVILCCLVSLQPLLGWLHHKHYVKHQRRGIVSHAHIWYGRALIILGMVNGGLGIQLAGNDSHWIIAYSVVAAVFAALYLASIVLGVFKRRSRTSRDSSSSMEETK